MKWPSLFEIFVISLSPINIKGQFHHHFMSSFYARRSQKRKKRQSTYEAFLALLRSAGIKAARKHADEIDPNWRSPFRAYCYFERMIENVGKLGKIVFGKRWVVVVWNGQFYFALKLAFLHFLFSPIKLLMSVFKVQCVSLDGNRYHPIATLQVLEQEKSNEFKL